MFRRSIVLAIALMVVLAIAAAADGIFYGYITFKDCECVGGAPPTAHAVQIVWQGGQSPLYYLQVCRTPEGYYTTYPDTYPPGSYQFHLIFGQGSDCKTYNVEWAQHGTEDQRVDMTAYGPTGHPDSGDE